MASTYKQLPLISVSTAGIATSANQVLTNTKLDTLHSDNIKVASHVQSLTIDGTTAQSFTAPASAKWVKVQADNTNTVNLKIAFGTTATSTVGHQIEPGRSEDFQGVATISVIAESAATTQKIYITWSV